MGCRALTGEGWSSCSSSWPPLPCMLPPAVQHICLPGLLAPSSPHVVSPTTLWGPLDAHPSGGCFSSSHGDAWGCRG